MVAQSYGVFVNLCQLYKGKVGTTKTGELKELYHHAGNPSSQPKGSKGYSNSSSRHMILFVESCRASLKELDSGI